MRVCLINPPRIQPKSWGKPNVFQPLEIAYVAALLERQHKVRIIDAHMEGWRNLEHIDETKYWIGLKNEEIADRIRPRTKYYANVLDRKSGKAMIWGFTPKTLGILLSYCSDPDYGDISHPEEGYDVVIERTGTGRNDTKYQIRMRPKQNEVDMEGVVLANLDTEVVKEMTEEELEEVLDHNFEDEDKPKKKKKKNVEDDEDDDDDDKDEDDE